MYLVKQVSGEPLTSFCINFFFLLASTISEGLQAIYGAQECTDCDDYRNTIQRLNEQNKQLQHEIQTLRGKTIHACSWKVTFQSNRDKIYQIQLSLSNLKELKL